MMSFWVVPWSADGVQAVLLGDDDVERQQPRRRRVDRHRRVHLVERDAVEQRVHVALVGDRDADLADLAARELVVGVVARLRRQVEGDRQPGLALGEVRAVELVGLLRGRMARVRPHHPRAGRARAGGAPWAIVCAPEEALPLRRGAGCPAELPSPCPPRQIDVHHLGNPLVICCFELDDVIVDPGPESSHHTLLEALDAPPQRILLTHIHFDHAGATGALVRRWPDVEVWVHERGAPHLIDPSRLTASATRLYGDDMKRLWGEVMPVPEANLRVLSGGETIGPWRVEYTPGHASHHVSYLHEPTGTAFVGDVGGVRIEGGPIIPPTPPPDIDVELWHASLDTVAAWDPARLAMTHFGATTTSAPTSPRCTRASTAGRRWRWRPTPSPTRAAMIAEMERAPDATATQAFLQAMPPDTLWPGLDRYWSKKKRVDLSARGTDRRASTHPGSGHRPGRRMARHRPQRRSQHVRSRGPHACALRPGRHGRRRLRDRRPDPQPRPGDRLEGHQEPAELYWEQLNDAGLTMAPLERGSATWLAAWSSVRCCATSAPGTRPCGSRSTGPARSRSSAATERTFEVEGHHFALVHVTGLPEEGETPYEVALDGERVWPPADWPGRRAACGRSRDDRGVRICFGSCRCAYPNEPPWTLTKDEDPEGREHDALRALALRMRGQEPDEWPHLLLMLGDQVYADEVAPATQEFIRARRDVDVPPGLQIADYEEYCRLYHDSWSEPAVRWLLSTVPTAMIFDDHDVIDDWNTSRDWVAGMRATGLVGRAHRRGLHVLLVLPAPGQPLARGSRGGRVLPRGARRRRRRRSDRARLRLPRRPRGGRRALELQARHRAHADRDDGLARGAGARAGRAVDGRRRGVGLHRAVDARRLRPPAAGHLAAGLPGARDALPGGLERGRQQRRLGPVGLGRGRAHAPGARPRALGRVRRLAARARAAAGRHRVGAPRQRAGDRRAALRRRPPRLYRRRAARRRPARRGRRRSTRRCARRCATRWTPTSGARSSSR